MHELPLVDQHVEIGVHASGTVHLLDAEVDGHADVDREEGRVDIISVHDLDENKNSPVSNIIQQRSSTLVVIGNPDRFAEDFDFVELFCF